MFVVLLPSHVFVKRPIQETFSNLWPDLEEGQREQHHHPPQAETAGTILFFSTQENEDSK